MVTPRGDELAAAARPAPEPGRASESATPGVSVIVQPRSEGLRLIRQHDHALAAGELAHAWTTGSGALPFRLVAAVGLHDVAWRELDRRPSRDPATGRPHAFDAHPLEPKLRAYAAGIDDMEAVDPWIGLLGSLHYSSFLDDGRAGGFLDAERRRRERLVERLRERPTVAGPDGPGQGAGDPGSRLRRHLGWLKFFDGLSLRLCLAPPGVPDGALPPWLEREEPLASPAGRRVAPRWEGEGRVELEAAPLATPVDLELPVRDLPRKSYPDEAGLRRAWSEAPVRVWRLRVVGSDRRADA